MSASGSPPSLMGLNHHDAQREHVRREDQAEKKLLAPFPTHSPSTMTSPDTRTEMGCERKDFFFLFFFFVLKLSVLQTNLARSALTGNLPQTWCQVVWHTGMVQICNNLFFFVSKNCVALDACGQQKRCCGPAFADPSSVAKNRRLLE